VTASATGMGHGTRRREAVVAVRRWPEGPICSGCFAMACETYGVCAGCGVERLLPGVNAAGRSICTDCGGGLGNYTCTRCGREGWRQDRGVCGWCILTDRLSTALDDGTGQVRPELATLFDSLRSMSRPRSGLLWLSKPHVRPLLAALAHGDVPLTHDGLQQLSPRKAVTHLRDLLVDCGVLPPADRFLLQFEQWLPAWLAAVPDADHARILHRYATWQVLRQLRATASRQPVGPYRDTGARGRLRAAAAFLTYLDAREQTLGTCRQADLDSWLAHAPTYQTTSIRAFLRWAAASREAPRLELPATVDTRRPAPLGHARRLALLRRLVDANDMTSTDRVVAVLILLYAQPLNRIAGLTLDDITVRDGDDVNAGSSPRPSRLVDEPPGMPTGGSSTVFVRFGDPPAPVPAPFDVILLNHIEHRANLTTSTNHGSRLVFPGRRAGQHIHPGTLRIRLQALGIPNLNGRSQTIRDLLRHAPASVIADALGYSPAAAERIAAETAGSWARYAAGPRP
jgi:hypothetical protein